MTTLRDLEHAVHQALRQERTVDSVAAQLGVDARRLGVYRDFIRSHVRKAVNGKFEATRSLFTEVQWSQLSDRFFAQRPASHWEYGMTAEPFAAWLAEQPDDWLRPFHVAHARYEWEEWMTSIHPADVPAPGGLDGVELEAAVLNPTLSILELPVPVVWASRQHAHHGVWPDPLPTEKDGAELVLLYRRSGTYAISSWTASDDLLFALKVAHVGLDPVEAAREAGLDVEAAAVAWERAVEIGLVIAPG